MKSMFFKLSLICAKYKYSDLNESMRNDEINSNIERVIKHYGQIFYIDYIDAERTLDKSNISYSNKVTINGQFISTNCMIEIKEYTMTQRKRIVLAVNQVFEKVNRKTFKSCIREFLQIQRYQIDILRLIKYFIDKELENSIILSKKLVKALCGILIQKTIYANQTIIIIESILNKMKMKDLKRKFKICTVLFNNTILNNNIFKDVYIQ